MAHQQAPAPQQRKYSTMLTPCPTCTTTINITEQLQDYLADASDEGLNGKPVELESLYLPLACPTCFEAGVTLCIATDDFYTGESTTANPVQARQRHKKQKKAA